MQMTYIDGPLAGEMLDAAQRDACWELALSIGARHTFTIGKDVA